MASIHDVAKFILKRTGKITAMKLQKLLYYCHAWSLVWDEKPLTNAKLEAWANGPVFPVIYRLHRGQFDVSKWPQGDEDNLTQEQKDTIERVIQFYGPKSAQWLSDLTHREGPWIEARVGVPDGERGEAIISNAMMAEYYGSLR